MKIWIRILDGEEYENKRYIFDLITIRSIIILYHHHYFNYSILLLLHYISNLNPYSHIILKCTSILIFYPGLINLYIFKKYISNLSHLPFFNPNISKFIIKGLFNELAYVGENLRSYLRMHDPTNISSNNSHPHSSFLPLIICGSFYLFYYSYLSFYVFTLLFISYLKGF